MTANRFELESALGPPERLALAYAPAAVRPLWLGLFALDARLARAARPGAEPVLAQIKLAWWRERFAGPAQSWPAGEPLLGLLARWDAEREALAGLVDGWEACEIGEDGGIALREARVEAMLALARMAGAGDAPDSIRRATLDWQDREPGGPAPHLSRTMRPLAVLRGLALREAVGGSAIGNFLAGVRLGVFGR